MSQKTQKPIDYTHPKIQISPLVLKQRLQEMSDEMERLESKPLEIFFIFMLEK